jgi:L-fuculose-phosphate aldolase
MSRPGGERGVRAQVAATARALHERGWVANHDGNVSARLGPDRFLVTPTATSKAAVDERNLLEVDGRGQRVAGSGRPFGELGLHLAVYAARPDIAALVHAHPPHATALACSGARLLERPFIAEAVVSLGASVPTLPFAPPGAAAAEALGRSAAEHDAVLAANHGAFAWGADLEQAYLRLELVEHLARIATLAQAAGGVTYLPDAAIAPLLEARSRAGLGAAADRAADRLRAAQPVVACAPAPHSPVPTIAPGRPRAEVAALVREEIARALRER